MQTKSSAVKYKGKVVATIEVPVFATVQEGVEYLGEAEALKRLNERTMVVEQNKARNANSDKPASMTKRVKAAFSLLTQAEALEYVTKGMEELEAFLKSDVMQQRLDAAIADGRITL